jgi:nicotinamidase-related amidase
MSKALLIVDIQNDYFPGGKMELEGSDAASLQARALLTAFRGRRLPVLHMQHVSVRPGATFFLPDTEGVKVHANVAPADGEAVLQKHFPNSFRDTALLDYLRKAGTKELVIAGMMTHMCIDATTRAASDLGFKCSLAFDACATRALAFGGKKVPAEQVHYSFLSALNGAYASVQSAQEIARAVAASSAASG